MTEVPKPRYEPPIMIDLRSMAKGKGYCAAGPNDTGGNYCTAGYSNPTACTEGNAAYSECTSGIHAVLACTSGGNAVS